MEVSSLSHPIRGRSSSASILRLGTLAAATRPAASGQIGNNLGFRDHGDKNGIINYGSGRWEPNAQPQVSAAGVNFATTPIPGTRRFLSDIQPDNPP